MDRPTIEWEIREPTGLGLGSYDLYVIRQKIYTGEFHNRCQFLDANGAWKPLPEHPELLDLFWLTGAESADDDGEVRRAKFGGWSQDGQQPTGAAPQTSGRVSLERKDRDTGLLGRLLRKKG